MNCFPLQDQTAHPNFTSLMSSIPKTLSESQESAVKTSARALLLRLLDQLRRCLRSWTESEREWVARPARDLGAGGGVCKPVGSLTLKPLRGVDTMTQIQDECGTRRV